MLNDFNCSCPVYIACGYTDLRLGIDGLAAVVTQQYGSHLDEESLAWFEALRRQK